VAPACETKDEDDMTDPHPFLPKLEHAFTITQQLAGAHWVKPSAMGEVRAAVYNGEGVIAGPMLNGKLIPRSGGDYPLVRPNGVIDFDARYVMEADDGAIIYLQSRGFRWGSEEAMSRMARNEPVGFDEYYMRVSTKFDAPAGKYEWMTRHIFVGVAEKTPGGNAIHYFIVR
jgi:hypothetical protein